MTVLKPMVRRHPLRAEIDWELARQVTALVRECVNSEKQPLARCVATLSLCIVNALTHEGLTTEQNLHGMVEAKLLMDDLNVNGYEAPAKEPRQ